MEVRRTVPVKLKVTECDAALLLDTIDQFRRAANYVVQHARDDAGYVITDKHRLHDRTYEYVREATELHTNLVQAARSHAAEALKSVIAKWRREYEKRRASMQRCRTRYAHEAMRRVGEKETDRVEQLLHRVANSLVQEAIDGGCSHIAFEALTAIRERIPGAKRLHEWAFRRLFEYVTYKAEERGISVEQVNPEYTSQRCSHTDCGFTHSSNRPSQEQFECHQCDYAIHADYNAAKNIGFKFLRSSHTPSDGDAPVGVRLNTGTLNTSGFEPAPDSVRVGVHGEISPR